MTFSKLDSKITKSSLWSEKEHVRCVWIAFLANKDENGFVDSSYSGMRRESNLTNDPDGKLFDDAIRILESPDPESRTPEFEGRRIQRVDGGWLVLNHGKYKTHDDIIRAQTRERVRKYRENLAKNDNVTQCNVTETLPSVSVSVSDSISSSVLKPKKTRKQPPEWKKRCEKFIDYQMWELEEYEKIIHDTEWIRGRDEFHGRLNILLTLKKAHIDFWSQMGGYNNIKKRKGETVDWRSTWANALTMRCNQVWKDKKEIENSQYSEIEPFEVWAQKEKKRLEDEEQQNG